MDLEQAFIRLQERCSEMLTPRLRAAVEYVSLSLAVTLFCILVVMHANYVQQPGCSSELSGIEKTEAQLIQIKITSAGLWSGNESEYNVIYFTENGTLSGSLQNTEGDRFTFLATKYWLKWIGSGAWRGKLVSKFWRTESDVLGPQAEGIVSVKSSKPSDDDPVITVGKEEPRNHFPSLNKISIRAAIVHLVNKWRPELSLWLQVKQIFSSFQKLWNIAGVHMNFDIPKWMHIRYLDRLNLFAEIPNFGDTLPFEMEVRI